jgi:hypothetical protein
MEGVSANLVNVIYQLLPGFLVAWILYGLTAYPKPSPFERVVQALIFTVVVRALVIVVEGIVLFVGKWKVFGFWDKDVELIWSLIASILLGLILVWCVNNDFPTFLFRADGEEGCKTCCSRILLPLQKALSKLHLTNKTLHANEWSNAFNTNSRFIVLHLEGSRRLYGWPRQFPDDPNSGHFIMTQCQWLLDDGTRVPLYTVHEFLVSVKEVERVEFLIQSRSETQATDEELKEAQESISLLYKKEVSHGDKCSKESATGNGSGEKRCDPPSGRRDPSGLDQQT